MSDMQPQYDIGRLYDRVTATSNFHELMDVVEQVTLSQPPERTEVQPYTGERALIAKLGAQGLRAMIEKEPMIDRGLDEVTNLHKEDRDNFDNVVFRPDLYFDSTEPGVQERVEAYGRALLTEAYTCLGDDVEEKIEAFRVADTPEAQEEVVMWLDARLRDMIKHDVTNGGLLMYHPVRLSPKMIGKWPEQTLPPTCLGVSVIAASFLQRAGAPIVHAGVMYTRNAERAEHLCREVPTILTVIRSVAGEAEPIMDAVTELHQSLLWASAPLTGYHAVVLTQLKDGSWMQVDSNFKATGRVIGDIENKTCQATYDTLQDLRDCAPALELTLWTDKVSAFDDWDAIAGKEFYIYPDKIDEMRTVLTAENTRPLADLIQKTIVQMGIDNFDVDCIEEGSIGDEERREYETVYKKYLYGMPNGEVDMMSADTRAGKALHSAIEKYVLHGESDIAVRERCRRDEAYLMRRFEDIIIIASMLRFLESIELMECDRLRGPLHALLEVGRAESRIGYTVASDFAQLAVDNPPSSAFWYSAWPSLIPPKVTAAGSSEHATEVEIAMQVYSEVRELTYNQ